MNRILTRRQAGVGPFTTARGLLPLIAVSALLFGLPIIMLIVGAFRNAPPGVPAQWSTDAFTRTYGDSESYRTLGNSVLLAGAATIVGTTVAILLVFLVARTTTVLRTLVTPAMVLVVALPPLFYAISFGMLGNPTIGLLNTTWRDVTGSEGTLFNSSSWAGLIIVVAIKGAAFTYLLLLGPFRGSRPQPRGGRPGLRRGTAANRPRHRPRRPGAGDHRGSHLELCHRSRGL